MKEFLKALNGSRGDLDNWLECYSEKEIRYLLIPIVQQRDELLAAAKQIRPFVEEGDVPQCYWSEPFRKALYELDEAIAKADLTQ